MLKVVVLDANAISRNLLTGVLVNGGYDVIGDANISSAGLAHAIKLQPQIICIDPSGQGETTFVILDELRNALPKTLVFLISTSLDSGTFHAALERGIHGFIIKPFNSVTVLKTIRNAILKLAKQR